MCNLEFDKRNMENPVMENEKEKREKKTFEGKRKKRRKMFKNR